LYKEKLTLLFVLFCLVFKDQCPTLALAKKSVLFDVCLIRLPTSFDEVKK
jgi:hypothetical protein